jgi:putative FmdB family regulatory protein
MPVYEYECPVHGRMEVQQRITEDALKSCIVDHCGQPVRKLISATSFALKGSGWYATDYAGKSGSKAAAEPAAAKADAKPEGGGCGKPECASGGCAAATAATTAAASA